MKLRDYQVDCIESLWEFFRTKNGNPLCALPVGTGKSVIIAGFLKSIYEKYPMQRVMMLTHSRELISQNYEKLLTMWPTAPVGINSAGLGRRDTEHRIIFAGIASVAKKFKEFGRVDLIIVDESHLISPSEETMYNIFFAGLRAVNPHLKVIGFTATPWRLGLGKIEGAGLFTDTCYDLTHHSAFNRLIDEGYILPLVPKAPKTILDVEGVHLRGGEFIAGELQVAVDREEVTYAALQEMLEHGHDRHSWLIFCSGIQHSINVANMLSSLGVECEAVHSKMGDSERDRVLGDFKSGKLRAVANNSVLVVGFDHPALDLIGVLRPTASPVLWVQALGRGTRPLYAPGYDLTTTEGRLQAIANSPKKNCLVLDFSNNTKRLGPINDPVIPRRKGEKGGDAPAKLCTSCNTWNHTSVVVCKFCGAVFPRTVKIQHQASSEELVKRDMPVVEVFAIKHVTYEVYEKPNKPPMMRVVYYSGLRKFNEYVCFEHEGFAARKARQWWRERTSQPVPATVHEAMCNTDVLKVATHLRVWLNKAYPEIMAYCFDGSSFGAIEPTEAEPTVEVRDIPAKANFYASRNAATKGGEEKYQLRATLDITDSDIPF